MSRQSRQFVALDESGKEYVIIVDSFADSGGQAIGTSSGNAATEVFRTASGMRVRHISKGVYELVQTWQVLRSSDPSAP